MIFSLIITYPWHLFINLFFPFSLLSFVQYNLWAENAKREKERKKTTAATRTARKWYSTVSFVLMNRSIVNDVDWFLISFLGQSNRTNTKRRPITMVPTSQRPSKWTNDLTLGVESASNGSLALSCNQKGKWNFWCSIKHVHCTDSSEWCALLPFNSKMSKFQS